MLRTVAMLLKNSVRTPDFVARYGGDEFVIVMPEADNDKALKLLERLRKEIETLTFPDSTIQAVESVKISYGTATFPSEARDMDGLITKADSRLYTMKSEAA